MRSKLIETPRRQRQLSIVRIVTSCSNCQQKVCVHCTGLLESIEQTDSIGSVDGENGSPLYRVVPINFQLFPGRFNWSYTKPVLKRGSRRRIEQILKQSGFDHRCTVHLDSMSSFLFFLYSPLQSNYYSTNVKCALKIPIIRDNGSINICVPLYLLQDFV